MRSPNRMCSPPKPAARNQLPHAAGPSTASPPSSMKQTPITGTMGTENAPPVMIPAPYSSNQVAGSADCKPARNNRNVRNAPATSGGANPRITLRAGPENNGRPRRFAFQVQDSKPIATARRPSASGQPRSRHCSPAQKNLSPARDRRKSRGALHGVANEAQVFEHLGSRTRRRGGSMFRRTSKAPNAMRPRLKHGHRLTLPVFSVKYFVMQRTAEADAISKCKTGCIEVHGRSFIISPDFDDSIRSEGGHVGRMGHGKF